MLSVDVDRPERTIFLLISTIDGNIRHDNDLLILIEIIYLDVPYDAVHSIPPKDGGVCIITHKYDVVRDAAPEIVVVRRVPPGQVVVHHADEHVVVRGVISVWYFVIACSISHITKYAI